MPTGRKLSLEDLTACRLAYEAGASYRDLAAEHGVSHSTIHVLLGAVGVSSRPVGRQRRPVAPAPAPQPRAAVEIAPDVRGRLRIPMRSADERRLRAWTLAERQAVAVELLAGRVQRVPKGRSGLPERLSPRDYQRAGIGF